MNMTETEAKTIACPGNFAHCLGSGCMAWRWDLAPKHYEPWRGYDYAPGDPRVEKDGTVSFAMGASGGRDNTGKLARGYCGLAGKPA